MRAPTTELTTATTTIVEVRTEKGTVVATMRKKYKNEIF